MKLIIGEDTEKEAIIDMLCLYRQQGSTYRYYEYEQTS